jgi:hypothetical protein
LWDGIINSKILTVDIAGPDEPSPRFTVERGSSSVPYPKSVCVLGGAVGNFGEGWDTIAARELENMGGILDDCSLLAEIIILLWSPAKEIPTSNVDFLLKLKI